MAKQTTKKNTKKNNKAEKSAIVDNTVITLTIPADEATQAYSKTLQQLKKNVSAPGFRKGNVPSKIAEEQLGEQNVIERALQLVVPKRFEAAMKKGEYKPLTQPEFKPVKLNKGEEWVIEAHIAEKPEISLKGYKKVVKQAKKDAAKHLDEQLKEAQKAHKKAAKEAKEKGTESPEAIKEPTEEQRQDHELHHIYQSLVNEVGPDIPELLVKEEVRYEINNLVRKLEGMNMKLEDFIKHQGITFEQLSSQFAGEALGRLQLTFVLDAIAEEEKLKVSKKEIDEQVDKIEDEKTREQQREDAQYRALVEQTLKRRKVAEYIATL